MTSTFRAIVFTAVAVFPLTGCTKRFVIEAPPPTTTVYEGTAEPASLEIVDARRDGGADFTSGRLGVVLDGMEDEVHFLAYNVARELTGRGIETTYDSSAKGDLHIDVQSYRMRNSRSSGFSAYYTFTTLAADVSDGSQTHRVTFYFKRGKVPVWKFREVQKPCYQDPIDLMIGEVASKINRHFFGLSVSDARVAELAAHVDAGEGKDLFKQVYELGFSNNPTAIPHLVRLTEHDDSMIRASAAAGLGTLGAADQLDLLKRLYEDDGSNTVQFIALKSIGDLATPQSAAFLDGVRASKAYEKEMVREVVDLYAAPAP